MTRWEVHLCYHYVLFGSQSSLFKNNLVPLNIILYVHDFSYVIAVLSNSLSNDLKMEWLKTTTL